MTYGSGSDEVTGKLYYTIPIYSLRTGFRTEGIALSADLSHHCRRDRTADDALPSVRNPDEPSSKSYFMKRFRQIVKYFHLSGNVREYFF